MVVIVGLSVVIQSFSRKKILRLNECMDKSARSNNNCVVCREGDQLNNNWKTERPHREDQSNISYYMYSCHLCRCLRMCVRCAHVQRAKCIRDPFNAQFGSFWPLHTCISHAQQIEHSTLLPTYNMTINGNLCTKMSTKVLHIVREELQQRHTKQRMTQSICMCNEFCSVREWKMQWSLAILKNDKNKRNT